MAFRAAVLSIAVLYWPSIVEADCPGGELNRSEMLKEQRAGWWVSQEMFSCLLTEYEAARNLEKQVTFYIQKDELQQVRIDAYKANMELERRSTERSVDALKSARQEIESADAWHQSPLFWFVAGIASTAAVVAVIGGNNE